ncbi:NAD-dependent protein deacylase [Fonticella tunisiensis]|uniref:NAD-dependent protein deacetylase n=1 Tax=Fonticella tunisiensis TaxID=1096341 RepID=A0A4R7KSR3_9CLOT|nr:NAD-dependent protein deacylase [Fonticella tunisiensis]TDT61142.1 NAD-dependent deacetylase [Fonticella tunisiensis]
MNLYRSIAQAIKIGKYVVFFGGAGVSTECGIPDFRSSNGIYSRKFHYDPETILSRSFFYQKPNIFYSFLRENILKYMDVKPNKGHIILAELERAGKLKTIITQNIDGLHQKAGSNKVLELHGSLYRFYCTKCFKAYSYNDIKDFENVPLCCCGGIIRPDIVLYEEPLDQDVLSKSKEHIMRADVLLVAGSSLVVYPAAGLLKYFKGDKFIIINKSSTPFDDQADIIIHGPFAETMEKIMNELMAI